MEELERLGIAHEYRILPDLNHGFLHVEKTQALMSTIDLISDYLHCQIV
jgi:dipeptidyl aminopeptidase/acylaminoacyl peptidase